MNISISGLGAVPDLEVSLKPLTIFVGENGTGKTWTAYTIAGIFGVFGFHEYLQAYLGRETSFRFASVDKIAGEVIKKGSATFNILEFSENYTQTYINEVSKLAPTWMNDFLGTKRADFGKMEIHVGITEEVKQALSNALRGDKFKREAFVGFKKGTGEEPKSELEINCLKEKGAAELYFYTTYSKSDSERIPPAIAEQEIEEFIISTIFQIVHSGLFTNVPIFPTEKTTFISFPFPYDREKHKKSVKIENDDEHERSGIVWRASQPVSQILTMIDFCTRQYSVGKDRKARDSRSMRMTKLGKFLEDKILAGNISTERQGNLVELLHNPAENISLELNVSSSMVKELTPLALYLKFLAKPGDLVVIDEPEMNLHPAAQVEMAEFLGMLVNAGLYVLITTHSPYIVDHIPNLIRANDLDKRKVKKLFYLKQTSSFLAKEKVFRLSWNWTVSPLR